MTPERLAEIEPFFTTAREEEMAREIRATWDDLAGVIAREQALVEANGRCWTYLEDGTAIPISMDEAIAILARNDADATKHKEDGK